MKIFTINIIIFILLIISNNIFSQEYIINKIEISGNEKTKPDIILRELTFSVNDTLNNHILKQKIERSKSNLINISLFNDINIYFKINTSNNITIYVKLEERWYLWPYPIFEHADKNFSTFIRNKDWSKVNYGGYFVKYNFRGKREELKIKARHGYKEQYSISYSKPYIDKLKKHGINVNLFYFQQHEIAYNTINNEPTYLRLDDVYLRQQYYSSFIYSYRPRFYNTHSFGLEFAHINVNDSIISLNSDYFTENQNKINYINISYNISRDTRDYKYYALNGCFYNINLKESFNLKEFSDFKIKADFRYYKKFANRFYFQTKDIIKFQLSTNNSYYFSNTLGYEDFLRGYEYYLLNGNYYNYSQNNIKFELLKKYTKEFNFIPSNKFKKIPLSMYINLYYDFGYIKSKYNNISNIMENQYIYSYGIGIDFVSYYDKVLRIEYSINKFGMKGIYLHLASSI